MSLYDKASLVQIPSGTKDGTLYSVLPANGNGDFDHTRASSATRVNKDGLIESVASGVPRLDYPLIGGVVQNCPALLLEPLRRNLFTDSDLSGLSPTTSGDGVATNTVLSNGLTGKKIDITSSGRVFYSITTTCVIGTQYTVSCYVEDFVGETESNFIDVTVGGGSEDFSTSLITNGRMQGTFTATATSVQIRIGIGTTTTRTGTKSAKIAGIQLEDSGSGSDATYATSLIPTSGTIITRSADECNSAGTTAEFNDSEGVLFAEIAALSNSGGRRRMGFSDGGSSDRVIIGFTENANQIQAFTSNNGTQANMTYYTSDVLDFNKIAIKYKANDFALWVNGTEVGTDTSGTAPSGLNEALFDDGAGNDDFYGKVKQLIVFNEALTDAELATLTS